MAKNTLGIIGKGHAVQHFFSNLNDSRRDILFNEIDRVLFYNYGYETGEDFKQSSSYVSISRSIEHLVGNSPFKIDIDVKGTSKNITYFFSGCDVILDASEGYIPGKAEGREKKARANSLCAYALDLYNGKDISNFSLSAKKDYEFYFKEMQEREQSGEKGRIRLTNDEFVQQWELSYGVLQAVNSVHSKFPIGERAFMLFPFSVPMLLERGKQFKNSLQSGREVLPTYITLVNEPCLASTIVTSFCPEMRDYTVACTGYDLLRLEDCLNVEFAAEKKNAGCEDYNLSVTLRGFHDKDVMVPVIYPLHEKDREVFAKVFEHVDYRKVHRFMKEQVGNYFFTHKDRELTSSQVDRALFDTIVPALQSKGKVLSVFPRKDERALCNGFFQEKFEDKNGLFLVGDYRFRNGKVISEDYGGKL